MANQIPFQEYANMSAADMMRPMLSYIPAEQNQQPVSQQNAPPLIQLQQPQAQFVAPRIDAQVKLPSDIQSYDVQKNLLGYKQLYDALEKNISNNADNQQAVLTRQKQSELANAANNLRSTAAALGIDTTGFNADDSLEKSAQTFQLNTAQAVRGLLNLPTTQQQMRDYYEKMRAAGLSPRLARVATEMESGRFNEDTTQQLLNGLQTYGVNQDGTMNTFGLTMAAKLINENPQMATLFSNAFALPKDVYNANNQLYQTQLSIADANQRQDKQFNHALDVLQRTQNFQSNENALNREHDDYMAKLQYGLKAMGNEQSKMDAEINEIAKNFTGGDRNKALELYAMQRYPNWFKVNRDENGNIKITDREKVANFTDGRFNMIEYFLERNNNENALSLIAQYRDALQSDDFKYAEQLDGDSVRFILEQLDNYEKVANGTMSLEEFYRLKDRIQPKSAADLSKANHDETANQSARTNNGESQPPATPNYHVNKFVDPYTGQIISAFVNPEYYLNSPTNNR